MIQMQLALIEALLILVTLTLLKPVESVNGVIWDKKSGNFVPIFSIPSFAARKQEVLKKSREEETHNFQGKTIRLTYYEITNLINSVANGTKVSGAIGEVWTILADHLNFTLKPILSEEKTLGIRNSRDIYERGLLKMMQFNQTDVIPRVEVHRGRRRVLQFTLSLWTVKSILYIRREEEYQSLWMLKLFSFDLWHAILWTYFLISACSYVSQTVGSVLTRQNDMAELNDHLLYNFGMIYCDQSYLPKSLSVSSCIVEMCLGIFSLLIRTAFGALVFNYLSQVTTSPPFNDIDTLLTRTSYNIVVLSGSIQELLIQKTTRPEYYRVHEMNRYVSVSTIEDLYRTGCSTEKQYAIFQADDIKKSAGLFICRLNPVRHHEYEYMITSGLARDFEYKKTIDLTILKLHESGIMRLLRERWIESKNVEEEVEPGAEPINMTEVYLILCVLGVGGLIAVLIFILENMIFTYYNKREPIRHISAAKNTRRMSASKKVVKPTGKSMKVTGEHGTRMSNSLKRY